MKKINLFIAFAMLCFSSVYAQRQIELHVGAGIPQSSFSDEGYANAFFGNSGNAVTGIDIAAKIYQPLAFTKDLKVTLGVNVMLNSINQNFKDNFKKDMEAQLGGSISQYNPNTTYPRYSNIPVMLGLNYQLPIMKQLYLYVNGEAGINFCSISDLKTEFKYQSESFTSTYIFNSSQAFAGRLGAGFLLNNKFSLGMDYNMLGSYKFDGKSTDSNGNSSNIPNDGKIQIRVLSLYVGYRF